VGALIAALLPSEVEVEIVNDTCDDPPWKFGIMVESGLMISPPLDTCESMRRIPASLRECGLHVPSFICFEAPFPGTPHFQRLAAEESPAFLPNALLRDFTGYTLVTRPKREALNDFIETYRVAAWRGVYASEPGKET
jgi:hypothetical protein